ncbi:MAG: hypothetical protein ACK4K0_05545 [Flavobacteriales bacterium]
MKLNLKTLLVPFSLILLSVSCGNPEEGIEDNPEFRNAQIPEDVKEGSEKIKQLFFSIPSPLETTEILERAGAFYDSKLTNDPMNIESYATLEKKAINLGIYGTDLNYANVFEKTRETMFFFECLRKLTNEIGLSTVINENTIEKLEENIYHRDSMVEIITDIYWRVDDYLKEDNRSNVTALIIAGGWIEGLYIGTQVLRMNPSNQELSQRIAEQKYSIENIVSLIELYGDDDLLSGVKKDFYSLKDLFAKIEEKKDEINNTYDDKNDELLINNKITLKMSADLLKEITSKTAEIRNRYISKV